GVLADAPRAGTKVEGGGGGHRHLRRIAVGLVRGADARRRAHPKHHHVDRQDTRESAGGGLVARGKTGPGCRRCLGNEMKAVVQIRMAMSAKESCAPRCSCRVAWPDSVVDLCLLSLWRPPSKLCTG